MALDEGHHLLVGKFRDGEYWAIQCKFKTDEDRSLTRKELGSYTDLMFNMCNGPIVALVCTNVGRFTAKLKMHHATLKLFDR